MTLDPAQRARLRRSKLGALVADASPEIGVDGPTAAASATDAGAALALAVDGTGWVHLERGDAGPLAAALMWAHRAGIGELVVLVDEAADLAARLAGHLGRAPFPVTVREVLGATSRPAVPAPLPPPEPDAPLEEASALLAAVREVGVEVVAEHGVIRAELHGLEVGRVVRWQGDAGPGELHLEAGVGRFDRDAVAAVRPDVDEGESLRRTVEMVRPHRGPGNASHPMGLIARSRWLRSDLVADPTPVGAVELTPVGMTVEAGGLRDEHPAAAIGRDPDGAELVVVCSAGVDPALVPLAADTRAWHAPQADLVLALPRRDHHAATLALAAMTDPPARVVAVDPGWTAGG